MEQTLNKDSDLVQGGIQMTENNWDLPRTLKGI